MGISTGKRGRRRRAMSDINVVPYIDVMLVLLIIFMVTAPLLRLGVDIQLPKAHAKAMDTTNDPVLVTVAQDGKMFLTLGKEERTEISPQELLRKVSAFVRQNPQAPVLIGGDTRVDYGRVYDVMVLLQQAGAPKVGLMSKPPDEKR
jgi:biopolymer transport protein TolR